MTSLTYYHMNWYQMPKTKADKYQAGLEYINDLSDDHQCKSFHDKQVVADCICMQKNLINSIKTIFQAEIKAFWDKLEAKVIETHFGKYLYPHCFLDSQRPGYIFTIATQDMRFCMNTVTNLFGVDQLAMTSARNLHLDKKVIGLSILKKTSG